MAKTRTGRTNKKQKTETPMEILLGFKRNADEVDAEIPEGQVATAAEEVQELAVLQNDTENIMEVDNVKVHEETSPNVKIPNLPELAKSFDSAFIQTDPPVSDQSLSSLLYQSEQKYTALFQKYSLLESLCNQNQLDEYKSLHQSRLEQLEATIELLTNERRDLQLALREAPSSGLSPNRQEELLKEIEDLKNENAVLKGKNSELESTVSLFATKQEYLNTEILELQDLLKKTSIDLEQVVQDRSKVVGELKNMTTMLTDQTALARRVETDNQKLKLEKSDLEAKLGQSDAAMAKLQAMGGSGIGKRPNLILEELQERINEETLYSQKLESICELAENMTGITVQNLEVRERRPLESTADYEYSCFSIKQRGSAHSITFEICVPAAHDLKVAYIPSAKLKAVKGLPDFLEDEIEFEREMLQEFFGNLKKFVDGEMIDQVD